MLKDIWLVTANELGEMDVPRWPSQPCSNGAKPVVDGDPRPRRRPQLLGYFGCAWPTLRAHHQFAPRHDALHAAGIDGPYILVGHAFGGDHVRAFADLFLDDVAGLVLVEADASDVEPADMEIIGMESSDGLLNEWRYGLEPPGV